MFQNKLRNDALEYGFLAHEVQEIFPELVNGVKDNDSGDLQAISYHQLFAICCEEIKTLKYPIRKTGITTSEVLHESIRRLRSNIILCI